MPLRKIKRSEESERRRLVEILNRVDFCEREFEQGVEVVRTLGCIGSSQGRKDRGMFEE